MARTNSTMLPLQTPAPNFALEDVVSGRIIAKSQFDGQPLLVVFTCNHCPYVKHVLSGFLELARDFQQLSAAVVMISSNDIEEYPDDAPDKMRELAQTQNFTFPYLFDPDQSVALAYKAACTPDFFLFDAEHKLRYRGQMDDARRLNDIPVTGKSLREALDAILSGREVPEPQIPALGCNIKWKAENTPEYFSVH